jgi:hypothetical protein
MDFVAYAQELKMNAFQAWEHYKRERNVPPAFTDAELAQMKQSASGKRGGASTHRVTKGAGFVPRPMTIKPDRPGVRPAVGKQPVFPVPRNTPTP